MVFLIPISIQDAFLGLTISDSQYGHCRINKKTIVSPSNANQIDLGENWFNSCVKACNRWGNSYWLIGSGSVKVVMISVFNIGTAESGKVLRLTKYSSQVRLKSARVYLCNIDDANAVFTLNGFDDQEWNLTFVKTGFQVLKFKFHACNFNQAVYRLQITIYCITLTKQKYFIQPFLPEPGYQTCMCKRGIRFVNKITRRGD